MNHVVSREKMRELDARTIQSLPIASELLMETAGVRCTDLILKDFDHAVKGGILVLCGAGNNGGDGLVIARHLYCSGYAVQVLMPEAEGLSPECAINLQRCQQLGIFITVGYQPPSQSFSLIIDALYGIGFRGSLPEPMQALIDTINTLSSVKLAIDIPSGIDANTGIGKGFQADATLAIEALKYAHLLEAGRRHSGKLYIIKIGIPPQYLAEATCQLLQSPDIVLPERPIDAHKGSFGRVVVIGGSMDYAGSIMLSAQAALHSGAGLIYLYSRKENLHFYNGAWEIMCRAIPETATQEPDAAKLQELLQSAQAIVLGPGLATDAYALKLLKIVLAHSKVPTVIDADAITLLAQNPALWPYFERQNFVLTPHKAEFCRLQKIDLHTLNLDIMQQIYSFQAQHACPLLLKDHRSIYSDRTGCKILFSGNDALATGGSGDILSGMIASFAAQQLSIAQACTSASLLMGFTAEMLSRNRHSYSVSPTDIIQHLGDLHE